MKVMDAFIKQNRQSGFTLIEALIAFVIFAVGILGALSFHAQLNRDVADAKAQREAFALAEKQLEVLRSVYSTTSSGYLSGLETAIASVSTPVSGNNANFNVAFSGPTSSAAPSLDDIYAITARVSWDKVSSDTGETDSISLTSYYSWVDPLNQLDEDEAGSGNSGYTGKFSPPTGNASSLDRKVLVGLTDTVSTGTISVGNDNTIVRVAIGDGDTNTAVELIELNEAGDPYVTITGIIYEHSNKNENTADLKLGNSNSIIFDYLKDQEDASADDTKYVVDVTASEGANCAVFYVGSLVSPPYKDYAKYVCVAGEGWNGTIQAQIIKPVSRTTPTSASPQRTVCAARSYKYLIVQEVNNGEITNDTPITNLVVKGQSGVVNFTNGDISIDGYFWPNPFYLVSNEFNPSFGSLGDIIDQNFVIHDSGSLDCEGALTLEYDQYDYDVEPYDGFRSASTSSLSTASEFADIWPGVGLAASYADASTYAKYRDFGNVVLGYVPYGYSIVGEAYFPLGESSNLEIIGQPEPLVSILCEIAVGSGASVDGLEHYDYQCAVPEGWSGYLIAKPKNSVADFWSDVDDKPKYVAGVIDEQGDNVKEFLTKDKDGNPLTIPIIDSIRVIYPCADDVAYSKLLGPVLSSEISGPTFHISGPYVAGYDPVDDAVNGPDGCKTQFDTNSF